MPKGDAPDIEGDVFLDAQDPPTRFDLGPPTIDHATARAAVTLTWPTEKRHLVVLLQLSDGTWKINDIDYGKDGKLRDLLK